MKSTIALIPARAGSKGVKDKNTRLLGERPLLVWSIAACLRSKHIDRTIVSTDSEEYADLARKAGADVPFLRPAAISGDRSTDYEFVQHALDWLSENSEEPELFVHIRPTTPFRDPALIDQAIDRFRQSSNKTALRSVHEMPESAYKTFEIGEDGNLQRLGAPGEALDGANNARQQFPKTYSANGYVDVLSVKFVKENEAIHGDRVLPFITPMVVEVDVPEDFDLLEYQLDKNPEIFRKLFSQD